ncbi:MAG TPA: polyhydroxyalkanoate synthesis regulator DNA-binding domain-containing protein [Verrucomicrobiae bacterium]|jgi:polyhydroxyalkanoate synthesis repressor PhaR|nr:polyhydroxyalkanoate synthesis regulator DNA-binding domain-containing protein [Verrucomicrobiae bacterium]
MAEANAPHSKPLDIRKYPNRRYYDVTRSQHLTLEDIRNLVREGHDIRVTDSKTSTDITAKVLAQIILELDAEKIQTFPVAMLSRLIRVNDQMAKDFLERYFDQAWTTLTKYRQQFEEQFGAGAGLGSFYSSLADWNRAMLNPFGMPFMGGKPASAEAEKNAPRSDTQKSDLQDKVSTLQQQIARLEQKLAKKQQVGKKRPRSATKRHKSL